MHTYARGKQKEKHCIFANVYRVIYVHSWKAGKDELCSVDCRSYYDTSWVRMVLETHCSLGRGAGGMRIRADALGVVDSVASPVHGSAIRQITNLSMNF